MNVTYIAADVIANRPPMLLLTPEDERDRHQLEKLLQTCVVAGFGRKPETFEVEHVRIELARRGDGLGSTPLASNERVTMKLKCEIEIDVNGQMTITDEYGATPIWSCCVRNSSAEVKSLATKVVEMHEKSIREIKERIK